MAINQHTRPPTLCVERIIAVVVEHTLGSVQLASQTLGPDREVGVYSRYCCL